jgi:very-short-patch-repair endonuclease
MKNYKTEPTGKYLCRVCNEEHGVKGFSLHLKKHGLSFTEYVKDNVSDFSPLWKLCPVCNENVTNKNTCSKKCGYILRSKVNLGVDIWKRMDEDTKKAAKKRLSEKASVRQVGRNIWSEMSAETKISARKKQSIKASQRVGDKNSMYGKKHSAETIHKIMTKRPMTGIERQLSEFLKKEGIGFYFQYFISKDTTHSYDFKIKGVPLIIELDGDYWHGGPGVDKHFFGVEDTKKTDLIKEGVAKERGFKLIRFWESEIKTDFEFVKSKILHEINIRKIHETD